RAAVELEVETLGQRALREHEPPRLAAGGLDLAGVEPRPVGPGRAAADGDRVRLRAQLMHEPAALLARDPSPPRHGDAAVEGDRGLVDDERPPFHDPRPPGLVLRPGLEPVHAL